MPDLLLAAYTFANAVRGQYCNSMVSRVPARLRWISPFGQKIELVQTMDVSRGDLLLTSRELI